MADNQTTFAFGSEIVNFKDITRSDCNHWFKDVSDDGTPITRSKCIVRELNLIINTNAKRYTVLLCNRCIGDHSRFTQFCYMCCMIGPQRSKIDTNNLLCTMINCMDNKIEGLFFIRYNKINNTLLIDTDKTTLEFNYDKEWKNLRPILIRAIHYQCDVEQL